MKAERKRGWRGRRRSRCG